jgi:2-hydroxychromene-2-carboxylate isomerase
MSELTRELSPLMAWSDADSYRTRYGAERAGLPPKLPARTEYALRRIGGLQYLEDRMDEFLRAFNEAPFPDSDLDTVLQPDERMKRMSDGGMQRVMR